MHRFGIAALAGVTNAGKSTLLNAMIGQKVAIVSPKPQTTRNRISGIVTRDDVQAVFVDTPGLHKVRGRMNRMLMDSALQGLSGVDVAAVVVDGHAGASRPGRLKGDLAAVLQPVSHAPHALAAVNKVDKVKDKAALLPVAEELSGLIPGVEVFFVSALTGEGVEAFLERVIELMPEGPEMYDPEQVSTLPLRFMAAEIVREKLFLGLHQELPYSTAVEIEHWQTDEAGRIEVHAVIYAARDTHKGMIIGKGGRMLKEVGTQARKEIQELVQGKVILKLWVKVKRGWTEDVNFLRSLGLGG